MSEHELEIVLRALEAAPFPLEWQVSSMHQEDVQKWCERYKIWYSEIRCTVLEALKKDAKNNLYYQIDRLVQEARSIQEELRGFSEPEEPGEPPEAGSPPQAITIGKIKKKSS